MKISFTTRIAATALGGILAAGCLSAQDKSSSYNSASESSSHPSGKVYKSQPAEIAATTAAPVPGAAPAEPTPADTKVRQDLTPKSSAKDPDKSDGSFVVGIADELQISVWKEPDLSMGVVVRPDGMITLPVVDDVYVVGLTTKQIQDILTEKLKPVVAEPQVTVIVKNIHSRKVYLVGQVGRPGSVALTGHETVLEILALSGGPGLYAKSDKIYILRNVEGKQQKLSFNYKKALKGEGANADFPVMNGDVIVVP